MSIDNPIELISIHIPKTGGRSLLDVLLKEYGKNLDYRHEREEFFPEDRFGELRLDTFPTYVRAFHAHLMVRQVMPLIKLHNPKVITWVRDPVERIISNYYFFMQRIREGGANEKQMKKRDYTLVEYATEGRKSNRMSAFLEGMSPEEFFFIGILERFQDDMDELAGKMGWKSRGPYKHVNDNAGFKHNNDCATQYKEIGDDIRREIERLNEEDVRLYNEVKLMRGVE
jgi:hypothetical protein